MGDIINYGTVDTEKFNQLSYMFLYAIVSPIVIVLGLAYLYLLVGWSLFVGLACTSLITVANIFLVKKRQVYQNEFMKISGKRIKKFSEVFNNITYVKANNYENHYFNEINGIREEEMVWNKKYFINSAVVVSGLYFTSTVLYIATFVTFILSGNVPTVSLIFTFIQIYDMICMSMNFFPAIIAFFVDLLVSSERLNAFLF